MLEVKLQQGQSRVFLFWPHLFADDPPTMSIRHTAGTYAPAGTRLASSASVTGVATDLRTLTVDTMSPVPGAVTGERGGYADFTCNLGTIPVRVAEIVSSTSIVLASPLPRTFQGVDGTLRWQTFYYSLTSADATQSVARVPFTLDGFGRWGDSSSLPSETWRVEGIFHVVRMPFATGLSDHSLAAFAPFISTQIPRSQNGWSTQIEAAERMLWRWIRADLQQLALTEDSLNGAAFHEIHALLTLHTIMQFQTASGATRADPRDNYLERAEALYAQVMRSIPWLDLDGDGVVDSGETDIAINSPAVTSVRGLFSGDSDYDRTGHEGDDKSYFRRRWSH